MNRVRLLAPLGLIISLGGLGAWSCTVDSSRYTFDDDEFDKKNTGGKTASGGKSATGAQGGEGGEGGESPSSGGGRATGGQGGQMGAGGGASCTTSELECNGKQLEICTGSTWIPVGDPCEFVCQNDQCTGVCAPNESECVNELERRFCDESGQWQIEYCENACTDDKCGGECKPGKFQCGTEDGGRIPIEVCDGGNWKGTVTICENGCEGGVCTGECSSGDAQCGQTEEGKPAVLACPASGDWKDAVPSPCVNQACELGECVGQCSPGDKVCESQTRRVCSTIGTWEDQTCDYVCTPSGCTGECVPGTESCDGTNVRKCSEAGVWETSEKCAESSLICIHLSETNKACGECNPDPKQLYCSFNQSRLCGERGYWEVVEDCGRAKQLCGAGKCFDPESCPSTSVSGCFDSDTGWSCPTRGKPAKDCPCDCSSGISCGRGLCLGL